MLNSDKSSVANDASINPGAQEYLLVRGNRHLIQDEWQTYVIDIEQLNCPNYPADDKSVKSISFGLFFNGHAGDGTEYVDVEYAAICDDWSEIEAVVGEGEKVVYTKWTDNNLDVAKTSGGQTLEGVCLGECKPTLVIEGNTYIYKCSNASCSNVMEIKTVNVGQDGVNYYNPAGQQYNNYHVTNTTLKYDAQHGFVYNSISLDISGSISFSNGNIITLKDTVYGGGKYFVFKVRAGESTVQMKLAAYDKTGTVISNAGLADPLFETNTRSQVNTEWVVYVIDATEMLNSATKYYTTEDAGNKLATFGYKIANGSVGTVDIAYFAVCDNWKEIDSVVGSDDVILTNWESPASDLLVTSAEIDVRANME